MKSRINILIFICLMGFAATLGHSVVHAAPDGRYALGGDEIYSSLQDPTSAQQDSLEELITFEQFGYQNQSLHGPIDSANIYFSLPEHWNLTGDVELELGLGIFGAPAGESQASAAMSSTLAIYLNDILVDESVLAESGSVIKNITLPQASFLEQGQDGRHQLRFILHSGGACETGSAGEIPQQVVLVRSDSRMKVPYGPGLPNTNLGRFPRPIYQRSITPDQALIVLPNSPSSAELQAALSVAAGLGNLTDRNLSLALINESGVTDEMRSDYQLIAVGRADNLNMLETLPLDAPIGPDGFTIPEAESNDGIVQMVNSPWNDRNVVLVVSGNTDEAVIKAGQATSTGFLQPSTPPNLSIVIDVQPQRTQDVRPPDDRSLQAIGYSSETLSGPGSDSVSYSFAVPPELSADGEPYVNLIYANSSQLDYLQSGVSILVNNELIGSVPLSELSNSQTSSQVALPKSAIRTGLNDLKIRARLIPKSPCLGAEDTWMVVQPESTIHLPLGPERLRNNSATLVTYSEPFILDQQLTDTAFVLPTNNVTAWQAAAQLAFDLGERSDMKLANFKVISGNTFPDEMRQDADIIMIGQLGELPLLDEIGDTLPVNFDLDATALSREYMPVAFQTAAELNPGYLLLSNSPWNPDRAILTILADDGQGIMNASEALLTPEVRAQLSGNFAIVTDSDIQVGNVFRPASSEPGATEASVEAEAAEVSVSDDAINDDAINDDAINSDIQLDAASQPERPIGLLLALIMSVLLIVVIILVVAFPKRRQELLERLRSR